MCERLELQIALTESDLTKNTTLRGLFSIPWDPIFIYFVYSLNVFYIFY